MKEKIEIVFADSTGVSVIGRTLREVGAAVERYGGDLARHVEIENVFYVRAVSSQYVAIKSLGMSRTATRAIQCWCWRGPRDAEAVRLRGEPRPRRDTRPEVRGQRRKARRGVP